MRKRKQRCKGKVQVLTYCTTSNKKYARFVLNNPKAYPSPIIAGKASGKISGTTDFARTRRSLEQNKNAHQHQHEDLHQTRTNITTNNNTTIHTKEHPMQMKY